MHNITSELNRAQISRAAIERLYVAMRHLVLRGVYKPLGVSGETMINSLLDLAPEIYGSIGDEEKVELSGLLYIFQRLPQGIEECRYIKLISREGLEDTNYTCLVPAKRRRNCYRVDQEQMYIEMVRGKSDIYDILTHLTFMYIESEKIRNNAIDHKGRHRREWVMLGKIVDKIKKNKSFNKELGYSYLSYLLGRTYAETAKAGKTFEKSKKVNSLFCIVYNLGKLSIQEKQSGHSREISFSSTLRQKIGHHIFGNHWALHIKEALEQNGLLNRPIHIISSNLHSVMNCFYAQGALSKKKPNKSLDELAKILSKDKSKALREDVRKYAIANGMIEVDDTTGVNIGVQIFDSKRTSKQDFQFKSRKKPKSRKDYVIIVMDYAFGEQAFELMDELLKPHDIDGKKVPLKVKSVNVMGKAGILQGGKGDIMIPTSFTFEGSTDNYPINNAIDRKDMTSTELDIYEGAMVTVLGTSLQNKDILRYFHKSSWKAIGIEMEGAHYQKAIQAAAKIRHSISPEVDVRYAYYASDNPLQTGSTLASGGLGIDGVLPTYKITQSFLNSIIYG
jgi:hypothetical protein